MMNLAQMMLDPEVPAHDKLSRLWENQQRLSEYCVLLRDALRTIHESCGHVVLDLKFQPRPPDPEVLTALFVKFQEVAAAAVQARFVHGGSEVKTETEMKNELPPVRSEPLLTGLIESGDRLSPFLTHGILCQFAVDAGKPCHCGLDAKWAAWEAAKSTANAHLSGGEAVRRK